MISTRRQVNTYRDHFGGYADEVGSSEPLTADISDTEPVPEHRDFVDANPRVMVDSSYSTIEDMLAAPAAPEVSAPLDSAPAVEVPKREKRERNKLNTDIRPSKKTQDSIKNAPENERRAAPARRAGTRIDPRTKVMLLVYVVIALVLAVAVIATGISITTSAAQTQSLYDEIEAVQRDISLQEAEMSQINETMRDRAIDLGMVDAGNVGGTVSGLEKIDYPDPEPHTNAFDKLCEFISNIIH